MVNRKLLSLLLFLLFAGGAFAQRLDIHLEDQLRIGDDEDASLEYLFAGPTHITTDEEGNIYVADDRSSEIRVFDSLGIYVGAFGERGRGPGELLTVSGMVVNEAGDVLVADQFNQRITRFIDLGESVETYPFDDDAFVYLWSLHALGNGLYGAEYRLPAEMTESAHYFHFYDSSFSDEIGSCIPVDDFYNASNSFQLTQSFSPNALYIAVADANTFFTVPQYYDGTIYRYEKQGTTCTRSIVQGMKVNGPAYELYDVSLFSEPGRPAHSRMLSGPDGAFALVEHVETQALFALSDGTILHLVSVHEGEHATTVYLQLFDKRGQLRGYAPIEDVAMFRDGHYVLYLKWIDDEDDLYFVDYSTGFPVIRIMDLEYEIQ